MGVGGLQAYRAEGEGLLAGFLRGTRESLLANRPEQRQFSIAERAAAVVGFLGGAVQGIYTSLKNNILALVELLRPSFWSQMKTFVTDFLPKFIDSDDFRFELGQMLGRFDADEERRLAKASGLEYGRSYGYIFGMALTEIVLTVAGLGIILKAVAAVAWLQRIARPLVVIAEFIAKTALIRSGIKIAQALAEAINALSQRLRRLSLLLPDVTASGRMSRAVLELQESERVAQVAMERAREAELLARQALAAGDEARAERHVRDMKAAVDQVETVTPKQQPAPEAVKEPQKTLDLAAAEAERAKARKKIEDAIAESLGDYKEPKPAPLGPGPAPTSSKPLLTPISYKEFMDKVRGVDLAPLEKDKALRARMNALWKNYDAGKQGDANRLFKNKTDYIKWRLGIENNTLPPQWLERFLAGSGAGRGPASEAGVLAERVYAEVIVSTATNKQAFPVSFTDPLTKEKVNVNVIPDFMPMGEMDEAGKFRSATTPDDALLIADSKYKWAEKSKGDLRFDDRNQIKAMLALAKDKKVPFVFLVKEGGDVAPEIRKWCQAFGMVEGRDWFISPDLSGLVR
jgi:hypothetical protein